MSAPEMISLEEARALVLSRVEPLETEEVALLDLAGRVAAEDQVAEIVGAKVVCVLIGERPGLATSESMSAYIVYNAHVGIPESKRTVVSNIHKDGLSAVEAGAYIVEVIEKILAAKASGVDLVK